LVLTQALVEPAASGSSGIGDDGWVSSDAPNPSEPPPVETPPPPVELPAARRSRPARDMALSMATLLIPLFVLLGIYKVVFSGDAPIPYDASSVWATARHDAHFPVLEPNGLPAHWTVISATYGDATLRVGYVTPAGTGLQLIESDRTAEQLLPAELGTNARPGNLMIIGDHQWRDYPEAHNGDHALVLVEQGRTIVVIGGVEAADLRTFASTLR
jgi:hypothetical protein